MKLSELGELGLLRLLRPHLSGAGLELLIGAGEDDAAAWREPDGSITVATCDSFVEGVHWDLGVLTPEEAGWRSLALTVSDLAAKGAEPSYGLVAFAAPAGYQAAAAEGLYRGLAACAEACRLKLVGGDTTSTPGPASLTVMALGRAAVAPIPRRAARAGWQLAVTGPLGGVAAGHADAFRRPRPRLREGAALCAAGLCCGDISDGLVRELDKFAAMAGVGARLNLDAIPLAEGVSREQAAASGEEMELVCAGPAAAILKAADLLTVVGELTGDGRVEVVDSGGRPVELQDRGYSHFG